jgi:RNA polymerase subunit RPABC4/transcription elongation factor Spt4
MQHNVAVGYHTHNSTNSNTTLLWDTTHTQQHKYATQRCCRIPHTQQHKYAIPRSVQTDLIQQQQSNTSLHVMDTNLCCAYMPLYFIPKTTLYQQKDIPVCGTSEATRALDLVVMTQPQAAVIAPCMYIRKASRHKTGNYIFLGL